MPAPTTWAEYHAQAAADEIARGNTSVARVLLRDARRAAHQSKTVQPINHSGVIAHG